MKSHTLFYTNINSVDIFFSKFSSCNNLLNQMAFLHPTDKYIYSTLMDKAATVARYEDHIHSLIFWFQYLQHNQQQYAQVTSEA